MPQTVLTYNFKQKIQGSKDLIGPEVDVVVKIELDFEPVDRARAVYLIDYYKKNYSKWASKKLEEQAKYFGVPIKSMQKEIDEYRNIEKLIKGAKDAPAIAKLAKQVEKKKPLPELIDDYNKYLENAAKNLKNQMEKVWSIEFDKIAQKAVKAKIKSDINWKKFRHVAGITFRTTLVVSAAALAIAATILSFGTAAIPIAAIGVASASLGGLSTLYKVGKDISSALSLEQKSIDKIEKDLKVLEDHLGKTKSKISGLPKHLDDASRFYAMRQDSIKKANSSIVQIDKDIDSIVSSMKKLPKESLDKMFKLNKEIQKLQSQKKTALDSIAKSEKRDKELKKVYEEAEKLVGDLEKIEFTGARSLLDSLKRHKNSDSVVNVIDMLNGVAGAGGGFSGAL